MWSQFMVSDTLVILSQHRASREIMIASDDLSRLHQEIIG